MSEHEDNSQNDLPEYQPPQENEQDQPQETGNVGGQRHSEGSNTPKNSLVSDSDEEQHEGKQEKYVNNDVKDIAEVQAQNEITLAHDIIESTSNNNTGEDLATNQPYYEIEPIVSNTVQHEEEGINNDTHFPQKVEQQPVNIDLSENRDPEILQQVKSQHIQQTQEQEIKKNVEEQDHRQYFQTQEDKEQQVLHQETTENLQQEQDRQTQQVVNQQPTQQQVETSQSQKLQNQHHQKEHENQNRVSEDLQHNNTNRESEENIQPPKAVIKEVPPNQPILQSNFDIPKAAELVSHSLKETNGNLENNHKILQPIPETNHQVHLTPEEPKEDDFKKEKPIDSKKSKKRGEKPDTKESAACSCLLF